MCLVCDSVYHETYFPHIVDVIGGICRRYWHFVNEIRHVERVASYHEHT